MTNSQAKQNLAAAMAHHKAGRLAEAEPLYRAVVERQPRNPDALHFFGVLLHQTGRLDQARDFMMRSIALSPAAPHYHANFAELLRALGEPMQAAESARIAVRLNPNEADAHHSLAMALRDAGDAPGAIQEFQAALRLRPAHLPAMTALAATWQGLGQFDNAVPLLRKAVALAPNNAEAHNHLGAALLAQGQLDEAAAALEAALRHRPDFAEARANLGHAWLEMGRLEVAIAESNRAVALRPDLHETASNAIMAMNYRDDLTSADLFAAHTAWADRFTGGIAPRADHEIDRSPGRRLRVGYISPDFRLHSVALFLEPLLAHHDADAVEVFAYSDVQVPDALTLRFGELAHHWRDVRRQPDEHVEWLIHQDRIDILVDLAGHTPGNRLRLFARRPAPLQVSYLGWQNTTGLRAIDYRLTDALVDPPGMSDAFYTEKLLRLDAPFAIYQPRGDSGDVAPLPAAAAGQVTFGSVAKVAKISPTTLRRWKEVLDAVPRSRMLIVAPAVRTAEVRQRLMDELGADRVELLADVPFNQYMALHARIDVFLDTFPFNGHTTTCHGLWMGVPTLTLAGDRYASRMGLAVMSHLGLRQFVAESPGQFVACAAAVAGDITSLAKLRSELRSRMSASALMDGRRLARAVEAAFRSMLPCTASPS